MISITTDALGESFLRPTPFISITQNAIRTSRGLLGSYYDVVLTGTILGSHSSPGYLQQLANITPPEAFQRNLAIDNATRYVAGSLPSIVQQQNALRELFRNDGFEFKLYNDINQVILKFHGKVQSINFPEGNYVDKCEYTINLRAEFLMDATGKVLIDGAIGSGFVTKTDFSAAGNTQADGLDVSDDPNTRQVASIHMMANGGFVENVSETWGIDIDSAGGTTDTAVGGTRVLPGGYGHVADVGVTSSRGYILTHNLTVTGRQVWDETGKHYPAWEQAWRFIQKHLGDRNAITTDNSTGFENFPGFQRASGGYNGFAASLLSLPVDNTTDRQTGGYSGYNHSVTSVIDEDAGSVTLVETWVLCDQSAQENYTMQVNKDNSSAQTRVSVNGTVKGLSSKPASSPAYGGSTVGNPIATALDTGHNTAYTNALIKMHSISLDGAFGPSSHCFKRAQSLIPQGLHPVPLSIAMTPNEFTGEISYAVEYDTRPTNMVSSTLQENIICSDTYPGDVFAVLPVIGRKTGPVLQYIGGRTEYQRNLSIDLTFDRYWHSGAAGWLGARQMFATSKPTLHEPYKSEIHTIIAAHSPGNENGIRKYFINPPQETWDAKTGKYTLNITWTYELNT